MLSEKGKKKLLTKFCVQFMSFFPGGGIFLYGKYMVCHCVGSKMTKLFFSKSVDHGVLTPRSASRYLIMSVYWVRILNYSSTETHMFPLRHLFFFSKLARDYKIYPSRIQRRGVVVTVDKKKKEITTLFVCSKAIT